VSAAKPISSAEAGKLFEPLAAYERLALAVSGGSDSLALLFLVARWCKERGARPEVTVLTVDHGLREDSREEALMVGRLAKRLGLRHEILNWREENKPQTGLQERARAARYGLMAAYGHAHNIPCLLTAHHLDDQAETFLMRLQRGSGLDGLAAIPQTSSFAGIAVLRPLLDLPKARLVATLREEGIAWAEDPSNVDQRFERARLRAAWPALEVLGLNPEALARSARRLRRAREALDHGADNFLQAHSQMSQAGYCLLERESLLAAPEEIVLRALGRTIEAVGARAVAIRLAKLEALLEALKRAPSKTHTLGGCRLEPLGARLGVFRETRGGGLPTLRLAPGERALWDNRFTVALGSGMAEPLTVRALGDAGLKEARSAAPWLTALPRFAGLTLPACWRGEELVAVVELGQGERPEQEVGAQGFRASFVNLAGCPRPAEERRPPR
jgi:tRNA(Ile)-lysidine synthase